MATAKDASSDGESGKAAGRKKKSFPPKSGGKDSMDVDQVEDEERVDVPEPDDDGSADDEPEEEYEIETILEARRGAFAGGRTGYLVKWKGYPEEENSWVDEVDAGNATALIEQFWKKYKKEKQSGRQSDPKPKSVKAGRKSAARDEQTSPPPKKRGRNVARSEDSSAKGSEDDLRKVKKPRKSNGASPKKNTVERVAITPEEEDGDSDGPIGDMSKHMKVASWEGLIKSVDTVERLDGDLWVYFTLKRTGERVKEISKICAERFPRKLIQFYESNLKWRTEDDTSSAAES